MEKNKKIAIITTTINYPKLLDDYAKDSKKYLKKNVELFFVIAGDKKTPKNTSQLCNKLEKKYLFNFFYLDEKKQNSFLNDFKELKKYLPWNSVQRRNVAILFALKLKAELIITIDDDNFLHDKDFLNSHLNQMNGDNKFELSSKTGWVNICKFLKEKNSNNFFHRGYPISKRYSSQNSTLNKNPKAKKICVNAGLWLGDPDVDAVTRLAQKIVATKYLLKKNFILDNKTSSPFNSQNTAIISKSFPAYFLSPFVGRLDDILASYVYRKVSDHLNYHVSYGKPIVVQHRNYHNIWKDLDKERFYTEFLEVFFAVLNNIKLSKKNYFDCTGELISKIEIEIKKKKYSNLNKEELKCFKDIVKGYKIWLKSIQKII
jgi:hypothetical protein